jgi:nitroimidazol reductase NimA-like FMN-containing flavoprotein (pyridoxamine 5'-phosphate oxidase superfamily)
MPAMTEAEWREFRCAGTRTGKLATTRRDGRPHVVPIWFVLDGDDLVFLIGTLIATIVSVAIPSAPRPRQ